MEDCTNIKVPSEFIMQGKLTPSSKMLENVAVQKVKADEIYYVV